jgi:chromosomal replication initiator protein
MFINDIQRLVCARFGVTMLDLLSQRRHRAVARPRQAAMWLCRHTTKFSLPQIGQAFGDRDHTTVLHAVRMVDALLERDAAFAELVWGLLALIDPVTSVEIRRIRMRRAAA